MLAVLLAGLLVAMLPNAFADASEVTLEATIIDAPDKGWYSSGESVEIAAIVSNGGEATSIEVDPSCNEVLRIWKDNSLILDGVENCLGQSRGMDLGSFSSTNLDSLFWDLTDSEGELVPSGDYIIEYFVAGEELSSTVQVHVQTPVVVPEGIELDVIATARDGVHAQGSPSIITVRLHNTLSSEVALNFGDCRLSVNYQLMDGCGPNTISGHEIVTIAQFPVELSTGENQYNIALGDGVAVENLVINAIDDSDSGFNSGDIGDLALKLVLEDDSTFGEMDNFVSDISITNKGPEDISLEFTTSCRGEVWIVDSSGDVVMDTLAIKECSEMDVEYLLTPDSERIYSQPEWTFIDMAGCDVAPGELLVVFEIPEHDLFSTEMISLTRERDSYCQGQIAEIVADISGEDVIQISPQAISEDNFEITWFTICGLETKLFGPDGEIDGLLSQCNYQNIISMEFTELDLETISFDMTGLEEGEYSLLFETISAPKIQSSVTFNWPIVNDQVIVEENEDDEEEVVIASRVIDGTWTSTSNDLGTCWLLNTPDEGIITLSGAPGLATWSPEVGASGQYLIKDSDSSPACADFATNSFTVEEVYSQNALVPEEDEPQEVVNAPVESEVSEISPVVITVGAVVAGGGILSLLAALIATNESWRIPTTSAGLWLLGLIGRTSETSDGRYQRGRLMGYLTANPGCHFRALMAALEMSNGQITHHLKVLEDEESIWRRPDGRLVRFYPYTSNLHPGILEEDLPLPPLSPDPNSLQGKILRLLDDDGNLKKYPTQAELAHRLDRSQQLVSHHLRTLQKFGLVEKKKMGIKNRYSLTREAMFLLDTTEV